MGNDLQKWAKGLRESDRADMMSDFGSSKKFIATKKPVPKPDKPVDPDKRSFRERANDASSKAEKSGSKEDHAAANIAHVAAIAEAYGSGDLKGVKEHLDKAASHQAAFDKLSDKGGGGGGDQPRDDQGRFASK